MSDDDFGDFAEANEETKPMEPGILLDTYDRPIDYLPSTNFILIEDYYKNICSLICDTCDLENIQIQLFSDIEDITLPAENPQYFDMKKEYNEFYNTQNFKGIATPVLADFLVKQGEYFCRDIWPGLSIRNDFLTNCNINEGSNGISETLPMMTETDENSKPLAASESRKPLARDFLGYEVPDLGFMLANSIQWPSEYLKQI